MEKKTLRAGFAGSGFAARFQYDALSRVSAAKVDVAGVYSPTRVHAEQFASERGIAVFDSLEELIAASDVIHVCTPPSSHEQIVMAALAAGKDVIVEKPFTGYFGDGSPEFSGDSFDRRKGLEAAMASVRRMLDAEAAGKGRIMYAENWVYAPPVQKEREIIEKSGAQVLWMSGEQSHSGSHSPSYGKWRLSGGGSLIGKGSHPIGAVLYLKQVEGKARNGRPIRPANVSARVHALTRMDSFEDKGYIKTTYEDIEDFAAVHIEFEDGTVADVFANEISLGGTNNRITVNANNHRTVCNMSHNDTMETYTPNESFYNDIYVVEKTETKQGWSKIAPEEGWFLGYQHELGDFYKAAATGCPVESGSSLAADTIAVIYTAYLSAAQGGAAMKLQNL